MQREISKIRKLGYAIDDEEEELAVRCVSVPVFQNGRFVAALSVTGTTAQLPMNAIEEVAATLRATASAIAAPVPIPQ